MNKLDIIEEALAIIKDSENEFLADDFDVAELVTVSMGNIGIRDSVFRLLIDEPQKIMQVSRYLWDCAQAADPGYSKANMYTSAAALCFLEIAIQEKANLFADDDLVDTARNLVSLAYDEHETHSLTRLFIRCIESDVPARVFYESVENVSLDDCASAGVSE